MQDRGCSPMSPSGMDDNEQDGLLASGEHTPMPFQSAFAGHTPSQAASAAPASENFPEVAVFSELPKAVQLSCNKHISSREAAEEPVDRNFPSGLICAHAQPSLSVHFASASDQACIW